MPAIQFQGFSGALPRLDPRLLPDGNAQAATNCHNDNGRLSPIKGSEPAAGTLRSGVIRAIYQYSDGKVMSWTTPVEAVRSPVAQDDYGRVYYTGDSFPRVTSNLIIGSASSPTPAASYKLGVPQPAAPIATPATVTETEPNNEDDETRYYVCTFVTGYGEEGPASMPSNAVTVKYDGHHVAVALPNLVSNPHNVNKIRVYRSATSSDASEWLLVVELPLGTTSYTDGRLAAELTATLETELYFAPPENMRGIVAMPGGITLGFAGNALIPSAAYLPYAYPTEYRLSCNEEIVALGVTSAGVVVATAGTPYLLTGVSPDSLTLTRLDTAEPCLSARSMVDMGEYVVYAGPEGLVAISGTTVKNITKAAFTKAQWQALHPKTMHAYRWGERYLCFYGDAADSGSGVGGFFFNANTGDLRFIDAYATAGHVIPETGDVLLVVNGGLVWFDAGDGSRPYAWKSARKILPEATSFSGCRVLGHGAAGLSTLEIYCNQALIQTRAILSDDEVFRMPPVSGKEWEIRLTGTGEIFSVALATSMSEL